MPPKRYEGPINLSLLVLELYTISLNTSSVFIHFRKSLSPITSIFIDIIHSICGTAQHNLLRSRISNWVEIDLRVSVLCSHPNFLCFLTREIIKISWTERFIKISTNYSRIFGHIVFSSYVSNFWKFYFLKSFFSIPEWKMNYIFPQFAISDLETSFRITYIHCAMTLSKMRTRTRIYVQSVKYAFSNTSIIKMDKFNHEIMRNTKLIGTSKLDNPKHLNIIS